MLRRDRRLGELVADAFASGSIGAALAAMGVSLAVAAAATAPAAVRDFLLVCLDTVALSDERGLGDLAIMSFRRLPR